MKYTKYGPFALRMFFGGAFLIAGLDKILSFPMAQQMFLGLFGSLGTTLLVVAILTELAAGTALLVGYHTRYAAAVLTGLIGVAFIATFKLGQSAHLIGTFREVMVMNTGGGNTAVNFAYLGGLISLMLTGSTYRAIKPQPKQQQSQSHQNNAYQESHQQAA